MSYKLILATLLLPTVIHAETVCNDTKSICLENYQVAGTKISAQINLKSIGPDLYNIALTQVTKTDAQGQTKKTLTIPVYDFKIDSKSGVLTFTAPAALFYDGNKGAQLFNLVAVCRDIWTGSYYKCSTSGLFSILSGNPPTTTLSSALKYQCIGNLKDSEKAIRQREPVTAIAPDADLTSVLNEASKHCQQAIALKNLKDYCANPSLRVAGDPVFQSKQFLKVKLPDGKTKRYNQTSQYLACVD